MMNMKWNCNACDGDNVIEINDLTDGGKYTCSKCGSVSKINVSLSSHITCESDARECFSCEHYKHKESAWEYGDAYGYCILEDFSGNYKYQNTICNKGYK